MNLVLRVFIILISIMFIVYVFKKVKKSKLSEKESLLWMLFSILILIISVFPSIINSTAKLIGVGYPPSLLFLLSIMFILMIIFNYGQKISQLNEKNKHLSQNIALLEKRIKDLENNPK